MKPMFAVVMVFAMVLSHTGAKSVGKSQLRDELQDVFGYVQLAHNAPEVIAKRKSSCMTSHTPRVKEWMQSTDDFLLISPTYYSNQVLIGFNAKYDELFVAFRGLVDSTTMAGVLESCAYVPPPLPNGDVICSDCMVQRAAFLSYAEVSGNVINGVKDLLKEHPHVKTIVVAGHSIGGSVAQLAALHIATTDELAKFELAVKVYSYGSPKVGDAAFVALQASEYHRFYRVVNGNDPVSFLPDASVMGDLKQGGTEVWITGSGSNDVTVSTKPKATYRAPKAIKGLTSGALAFFWAFANLNLFYGMGTNVTYLANCGLLDDEERSYPLDNPLLHLRQLLKRLGSSDEFDRFQSMMVKSARKGDMSIACAVVAFAKYGGEKRCTMISEKPKSGSSLLAKISMGNNTNVLRTLQWRHQELATQVIESTPNVTCSDEDDDDDSLYEAYRNANTEGQVFAAPKKSEATPVSTVDPYDSTCIKQDADGFDNATAIRCAHYVQVSYCKPFAQGTFDFDCGPACSDTPGASSVIDYRYIFGTAVNSVVIMGLNKKYKEIFVAFRGTGSFGAWMQDFAFCPASAIPYPAIGMDLCGSRACSLHRGFYDMAFEILPDIRLNVLDMYKKYASSIPDLKVLVTGHSLGGGMSNFVAVDLQQHLPAKVVHLYTMASPRVGDATFARYQHSLLGGRQFRIVTNSDPVAHLPLGLGYVHGPPEVWWRNASASMPQPVTKCAATCVGEEDPDCSASLDGHLMSSLRHPFAKQKKQVAFVNGLTKTVHDHNFTWSMGHSGMCTAVAPTISGEQFSFLPSGSYIMDTSTLRRQAAADLLAGKAHWPRLCQLRYKFAVIGRPGPVCTGEKLEVADIVRALLVYRALRTDLSKWYNFLVTPMNVITELEELAIKIISFLRIDAGDDIGAFLAGALSDDDCDELVDPSNIAKVISYPIRNAITAPELVEIDASDAESFLQVYQPLASDDDAAGSSDSPQNSSRNLLVNASGVALCVVCLVVLAAVVMERRRQRQVQVKQALLPSNSRLQSSGLDGGYSTL